jgi:hypothetical protein
LTPTLDEWLENVARHLAGRRSRREVFRTGGAFSFAASLFGFDPIQDAFTATATASKAGYRDWKDGFYGMGEVGVCYAPMKVVATEPELAAQGRSGVLVRKGPSFDAPPAPRNDGAAAYVPLHRHFGRQSVRRAPGPGCKPAKLRPMVNGWVWGYPADDVRTNKSGWVPVYAGGVRYLEHDLDYGRHSEDREEWVCGPNHKDFDCRSEASKPYCNYECTPGGRTGLRYTGRMRRVLGAGGEPRNSGEEYYLRHAASSTAFTYLAPGDMCFELGIKKGLSYGPNTVDWSFVEVRKSRFTPVGTRGFCLTDAFLPARKRFLAPHLRRD